jgi:hypothetical protein
MKRFSVTLMLLAFLSVVAVPAARAQGAGEAGVFAHYFDFRQADTQLVGLGGRVSFNTSRSVQIEGEVGYDFTRAFTERYSDGTSSVNFVRTDARMLDGLIGPKFQTTGRLRLFVTVKGGFTHFDFSNTAASIPGFTSELENLRSSNVNPAIYPGAGIEGYFGALGLRVDIGDEIYFASGSHHNLRITAGPVIRF